MNLAHVGNGFFRRTNVGFRDNFKQRRTGAVQIDARRLVETFMNRLARILLEVRARDADALVVAVRIRDEQLAVLHDRQFVLADLVALGQVRVEIILARKY